MKKLISMILMGGILMTTGCIAKEKNKEMLLPVADVIMVNGKTITVNNNLLKKG